MRKPLLLGGAVMAALLFLCQDAVLHAETTVPGPPILQRPAISKTSIVFGYAGDLWTVSREGGRAERLTTGVGIETSPAYSPDGSQIAFTGDYDGNTDVFTVPAEGGVPTRITYHPATDNAVGWTPDGKSVIFRSGRESESRRFSKLFQVAAQGGLPKALPVPMGYYGQISPDGRYLAYVPTSPAFGFNYSSYVSWRNYRGGLAPYVWIVDLKDLSLIRVPHTVAADFNPVWLNGKVYFLSERSGSVSLFSYDMTSKEVKECIKPNGDDIHSLSAGGGLLVFERLGEIYTYDPANGKEAKVRITLTGDMPELRTRFQAVNNEIQNGAISSTGKRAVFEAHGEILTVPAKDGPTRNLTNTPGTMERSPRWSPDGKWVSYLSDESGNYAIHVQSQNGEGPVKKFALAPGALYYTAPTWSPDSKMLALNDNALHLWILTLETGKLTQVGEPDVYMQGNRSFDWSPDSKWLAYSRSLKNLYSGVFLYNVQTGQSYPVSDGMSDASYPAFDHNGKYLYFAASTNDGGMVSGLDMTTDLYQPTYSIYALVLAADGKSPLEPRSDDENSSEADKDKDKDGKPADKPTDASAKKDDKKPEPTKVDVDGLMTRLVALPVPPAIVAGLSGAKPDSLLILNASRFEIDSDGPPTLSANLFTLKDKKTETLATGFSSFDISSDAEKMLLGYDPHEAGPTRWTITSASAPAKPGEGTLNLSQMNVKVDPRAEWRQMYHEVWQIERSYFYDPQYHGVLTEQDEKRYEPYLNSLASRADLNYLFQEMLGPFSIGHLRGFGGNIPEAKKVPGGLLGADFEIVNDRYRISRIYTGELWNPQLKAPLAQPGLKVGKGDFILAINGHSLSGSEDVSQLLEGTSGQAVVVKVASDAAGSNSRDVTVIPIGDDGGLRHAAWIEGNRRKVWELSQGKLAYVYLPDTGGGGFTNFNRYYFAQLDKQGAVIDERFNSGGQVANYFIEVMQRQLMSWWSPRYGAIYKTPATSILGPKVMLANEFSGSGGDALPWLFREAKLGPIVGKRTWGGLVGIGGYPSLMDGGQVTSPDFGFFSPEGKWDVENHGVQPDFEVDQEPKAVSEGHDPQLEKAVSLALDELSKKPVPEPKRPVYPNYRNGAGPQQ